MCCNIQFIATIITILVGILSYNYFSLLKDYEGPVNSHSHCKVLRKDGLIGPEDFVQLGDLLITGTDERLKLYQISTPKETPQGQLFVIHPKSEKIKALELKNYPSDLWFHPHGLSLYSSNEETLLYIINHAYEKGGERIEVFKVIGKNFDEISIEYYQSIAPEIFSGYLGGLNDLAVIEPGKFYITQYRPFPDCPDGRDFNSQYFKCKIYGVLNFVYLFTRIPLTAIFYVSYNPNLKGNIKEVEFFPVSQYESMFNGIHYIPKEDLIIAANPIERIFNAYTVNHTSHQLTKIASIKSPLGIDNFSLNEKTGAIYGGAVDNVQFFKVLMEVESTHKLPENTISGGLIKLEYHPHRKELSRLFGVSIPLYLPGSFYSGISVVSEVDDLFVFGSWYDNGIGICKVHE